MAGVGVRVKKFGPIKAKVYSAGFYVEKDPVTKDCKSIACKDIDSLNNSKDFESSLIDGKFEKRILLRMARSVGTDTMVINQTYVNKHILDYLHTSNTCAGFGAS